MHQSLTGKRKPIHAVLLSSALSLVHPSLTLVTVVKTSLQRLKERGYGP
jgi:hypothetical protein